jgi:MFS family permease
MLLCAIATFAAGSAICASASNITVFLVGRSMQGIGAGGLICLVNVCISDMFSLR